MQNHGTEIDPRAKQRFDRVAVCGRCFRPKETCFCNKLSPLDNKIRVVVLQHPQEQFKVLSSARLTHLLLHNSRIFTGLSWPNFKKVAGPGELPSAWGVLFLRPSQKTNSPPFSIINRHNKVVENGSLLRGIIALDGSWKQAKTLWWRNPWLLRMNRIQLNPDSPSMRPQVKSACLSTIESVAFVLERLGEDPAIPAALRKQYELLIVKS